VGENALNPQGPQSGQERVNRGGSFREGDYFARSSNRGWNKPEAVGSGLGFRCAASLKP